MRDVADGPDGRGPGVAFPSFFLYVRVYVSSQKGVAEKVPMSARLFSWRTGNSISHSDPGAGRGFFWKLSHQPPPPASRVLR